MTSAAAAFQPTAFQPVAYQTAGVPWYTGPVIWTYAPRPQFSEQAAPQPFGSFYQRVGAVLAYGIQWEDWLAIRWQPVTSYALNAIVQPWRDNGFQFACVLAGMSDSVEPAWEPYLGAIVFDGSVQWQCQALTTAGLYATVAAASWSAPAGITIVSDAIDGQATIVLVDTTQATVNTNYVVQCTLTTSDGQQAVGSIEIMVR